jgi:hypothetical protein
MAVASNIRLFAYVVAARLPGNADRRKMRQQPAILSLTARCIGAAMLGGYRMEYCHAMLGARAPARLAKPGGDL